MVFAFTSIIAASGNPRRLQRNCQPAVPIAGTRTTGRGGIARTNWATGANAGTTIVGDFRIVARYTGSLPVGTSLDKTGRTSGSTYGNVTNSCVTIGNLRCQDISKVWSEGGDSGGPWFSGNTAYGSHTYGIGNDSAYMPIDYFSGISVTIATS